MKTCAIVGINWGDEGKGRMVDLIAKDYDVVVRYQGGSNAGHTVINEYGKFALNLIPSGIFRPEVINILGNGTVIDLEHLSMETGKLRKAGVKITPENLKISDRAMIVLPYHKALDELEENRLQDKKYGSTKRGIGPAYSDKYIKKGIMAGELLYPEYLHTRLKDILKWKNLVIENVYKYNAFLLSDMTEWLDKYAEEFKSYICNTGKLLRKAQEDGKSILFEAQLGALRDIDYGIYPYTSSSTPLASYGPIGSGAPELHVEHVIGVVKAYSSCVGEGPFTAEWFGEDAEKLRKAGNEYGAATGRPRRVGPLDILATSYGVQIQGADCIALTKMDVLSYMDNIPVCIGYESEGKMLEDFPLTPVLEKAKPVFIELPGWKTDISKIRTFSKLPKQAQEYVLFIEEKINCPIRYISIGPERDAIIFRGTNG
ncbi:MAG: Adenylosuccinate synthetase [Firmicutes bacterium ADurb.Bin146]|nr:MAG: Adenylosuccinate synthetase [Firmicutes bacterium ADurb.Bin146]